MQVGEEQFNMKSDGFLPRHKAIECYHQKGNKIFGIKFNISPVIFEKKINFSEYKKYIFPLSYLLDESIINKIKKAGHFNERTNIVTEYFNGIVKKYMGSSQHIQMVTSI